jgi:2-polyprenyl-3-methyl-5-hydroxy-6-metoxy-1,4-benzoquinol methylase
VTELIVGGLHKDLLPEVVSLEGVTATTPILDLGSGQGACLACLHAAGFVDLWGVDCNSERFGAHRIAHFTPGDLMADTEWPVRKFGFVSAIEVIEHVENPERVVAVGARCLAAGGWLMITTPNIHLVRARTPLLDQQQAGWVRAALSA